MLLRIVLIYLLIMNLAGLYQMHSDKERAKSGAFRVPEASLFRTAIFGGSIGSILGMYLFHHKTRHLTFVIGMPFILFLQIGLTIFLLSHFGLL